MAGRGVTEWREFYGSPETTLGVEIELQIVDPKSLELVPGAMRLLDACREDIVPGVTNEFLLSMVELKTAISADVAEVRDTLLPALRRVRNIAMSLGYDLVCGGSHPSG